LALLYLKKQNRFSGRFCFNPCGGGVYFSWSPNNRLLPDEEPAGVEILSQQLHQRLEQCVLPHHRNKKMGRSPRHFLLRGSLVDEGKLTQLFKLWFIVVFQKLKDFGSPPLDGPQDEKSRSSGVKKLIWFCSVARNAFVVITCAATAYLLSEHNMAPFSLTCGYVFDKFGKMFELVCSS
jgi:hypothetical protein